MEIEAENRPLCTELDDMKVGLNDLEQYGRRNSLRFHNLKMDPSLKECDMTHSMTKFIKKSLLDSEENITDRDIESCHPIGRKVGTSKP